MIQSFDCSETEKVWEGKFSKRLPQDIQRRALRMLRRISAAAIVEELREPPSNHLEQLSGYKVTVYSVRVNKQWRITFRWGVAGPELVKIEDYH